MLPVPQSWRVQIVPSPELRLGGALIASGSLLWVVHSLLIFASWVPIVAAGLSTNPAQNASLVLGFYAAALGTVIAGAALLAVGALLIRRASAGYFVPDTGFRATLTIPPRAERMARAASPFFLSYGLLAAAALALLLVNSFLSVVLLLVAWVAGAAMLLVGSLLFSSFMQGVRRETGDFLKLGDEWLRDYAIANLIGASLLFGSVATPSLELGLALTILGGAFQFLAVPISGIVVFGELVVRSVQISRARTEAAPSEAVFAAVGFRWPATPSRIPSSDPAAPLALSVSTPEMTSASADSVPPPKTLPLPPPPDDAN